MKKLLIFDVDSTLINEEVIELLASHAGVQKEVKEITARAMAGELDFEESLKARVRLLRDLPVSVLSAVQNSISLTLGAKELIVDLQSKGHIVAVVSGGFRSVIEPLMQELNIDIFIAHDLEIIQGKLTGNIEGTIIDRSFKADFLKLQASKLGIDIKDTIAVGDGANDIEMVKSAGTGIAFCAKPILNLVADVVISNRDLREVLNYL